MQNPDNKNINKAFLFVGSTGCLLPLFIILNLFFGWIFFSLSQWAILEAVLILIFSIKSSILAKKISSLSSGKNDSIDVEGRVVDDTDEKKSLPKD